MTGTVAPHLAEGRLGERIACRFLLRQGFDIIARRYKERRGEVDLIAFEGQTLVFVEVKTRRSREYGDPAEFVDWKKQQRLRMAAEDFIARCDLCEYTYRFDIVTVVAPATVREEVSLFRNAF
jgi:putative endonuclease